MSFQNKQKQHAQSVFMSSVELLANTAAFVATFFALPLAYDKSIVWITKFAAHYYSSEVAGFVFFAWYVVLGVMIFAVSRASLSVLLIIGGVAIAVRYL